MIGRRLQLCETGEAAEEAAAASIAALLRDKPAAAAAHKRAICRALAASGAGCAPTPRLLQPTTARGEEVR